MGPHPQFRLLPANLILAAGLLVSAIGCEPSMPVPPPRESKSAAEDDFLWAMERMEHAIERFRPASSLGLSVKRELDYELMPPSAKEPNYTAHVKITMKTVYRPDAPPTAKEKKQAAAEKEREAKRLKLDNPYVVPGQEQLSSDDLPGRDIPPVELPSLDVPDPRIPTQRINEEKEYLLEYANDKWELVEPAELEEHERMWFDYALQQGEFALDAGVRE